MSREAAASCSATWPAGILVNASTGSPGTATRTSTSGVPFRLSNRYQIVTWPPSAQEPGLLATTS